MVQILHGQMDPVDVLCFRSPKPFRIGGYAETEHIPPPGTVALAFTAQLHLAGLLNASSFSDLLKRVGEKAVFHGPFLSGRGQLYIPAPLDMAECPEHKRIFLSEWRESLKGGKSPWRVHKCGRSGKTLRGYLISSIDLLKRGGKELEKEQSKNSPSLLKVREVFKEEIRPGLSLERKSKIARPGYFYQAAWVRIKSDYGLHEFVTIKDEDWGEVLGKIKMLKLGRGGRPTELSQTDRLSPDEYYKLLTGLDMSEAAHKIANDRAFDLILLTPAIFLSKNACRLEPGDLLIPDVDLIGVATDRPVKVSGWDFERKAPRAMYYAAPAGTVYRYELRSNQTPDKVMNVVIRLILLENVGFWREIGYGTAVVVPLPYT